MPIKKSDLYHKIWKSCDKLRGGMDPSQYKDYILPLLALRYATDKAQLDPNFPITFQEDTDFNYFKRLQGKTDIGDKMNTALRKFEKENNLEGLFGAADFNDSTKLGKGAEKVKRLSKLISIFADADLDLRKHGALGDEILGDAYEYLMKHFATESGKSKGEFYTPAAVSHLMAQLIQIHQAPQKSSVTLYDPTCGSGSLLLKAAHLAPKKITIYGQEKNRATALMARLNMLVHSQLGAEIKIGDTLREPLLKNPDGTLKKFHYIVANPPFSAKSWGRKTLDKDSYGRFDELGLPPEKNGDYAFLLHIIKSLKRNGKAAVILPHGVLFRGNAEARIRRNIIHLGYIKAIIGLPANLFYGTSIPACILLLDKGNAQARQGIFMIDASQKFAKAGSKNKLRARDIHEIATTCAQQQSISHYARLVSHQEIQENEYNLNLSRYINTQPPQITHDIQAHLHGIIPAADIDTLLPYWQALPQLKNDLFISTSKPNYYQLKVPIQDLYATLSQHTDVHTYQDDILQIFQEWQEAQTPLLTTFAKGTEPKKLIEQLSHTLLEAFAPKVLIDEYAVYQLLMDYWNTVLQDDLYTLATHGWPINPQNEILPQHLIVNKYLPQLQTNSSGSLESKKATKQQRAQAQAALQQGIYELHLTQDQIQYLIIQDKWMATLRQSLQTHLQHIIHDLATQLQTLAKRYEQPLAYHHQQVADLQQKVHQYLEKLGFQV